MSGCFDESIEVKLLRAKVKIAKLKLKVQFYRENASEDSRQIKELHDKLGKVTCELLDAKDENKKLVAAIEDHRRTLEKLNRGRS